MTPSGADRPKGLVCRALLDPPHPTSSIPPLLPQALLLWGRVQQEMSFLHCGFPISRAGWKGEEGDRSFPGTTDGVSVSACQLQSSVHVEFPGGSLQAPVFNI